MKRFVKVPARCPLPGIVLSAAVLLGVVCLFTYGVDAVSQTTQQEQLAAARRAVARAAVHCYALEGAYPPDMTYLEEHYGLAVNQKEFAIRYNCFASNLMPEIDVLPLDS